MATLQVRNTLTVGATKTVATDGNKDIVINVTQGEVEIQVIVDSAQTDGYGVKLRVGAVTVVAAYSLIFKAQGTESAIFEVYAAS